MRGLKRLGLWAVTLLLAAGSSAHAQSDYPNKPIRLVVGFTPGSVADITARVLGNRMGQILGQQIVVENRPGAASQGLRAHRAG
jgi:tripartite-type tricarboxylate transporter receptor subunit TctC